MDPGKEEQAFKPSAILKHKLPTINCRMHWYAHHANPIFVVKGKGANGLSEREICRAVESAFENWMKMAFFPFDI
jgi:hypothetical protein